MSPPLAPGLLLPLLEEVRRRRPSDPVIGVRHGGPWAGADTVLVDGASWAVRACASTLDVRQALAEQEESEGHLVIITPLDERTLGLDLLARIAGQRLVRPNLARAVMQRFGAFDLDRRVARQEWLLRALLEAAPSEGYAPVPGGALTEERAWEELLRRWLGLPVASPTARELLWWGSQPENAQRLHEAPDELVDGLRRHVAGSPGAAAALAAARHAAPGALLAVGLVCKLLAARTQDAGALLAAGQLAERHMGGFRMALPEDAAALAAAAERLAREHPDAPEVAAALTAAEELVEELGLAAVAAHSEILPSAWSARLQTCRDRVLDALRDPASATARADLEEAIGALRAHVEASRRERLEDGLQSIPRLLRWLNAPDPDLGTLSGAIRAEVESGAWVTWARTRLDDAAVGALAGAVAQLGAQVDERRARSAVAFGERACRWESGEVMGVEHVLEQVVAPAAGALPLLLIVLDGASGGALRELGHDLSRAGWVEWRPAQLEHRPAALAVLPSLTTASRASLLSGELCRGGQGVEVRNFAAHAGLRQAGVSAGEPLLLHKRDLSGDGSELADRVREEIHGRRRVLGVVLNVVDDQLSGAMQLAPRWTLGSVPLLSALLDAAGESGRAVILASDHGHVLEWPATQSRRPESGRSGDRWRSADGPPAGPGEVRAGGPRVLHDEPEVILAADPLLRYGTARPGYHGGASPEELVAPLAILTRADQALDGFVEQPPQEPEWWREESAAPAAAPEPAVTARRPPKVAPGQLGFGIEAAPPAAPVAPWIDDLLGSSLLASQRERFARTPVPDARVRGLLGALAQHDGRLSRAALAAAAGVPLARLDQTLAALRPLLNVDGYPILTVDAAADLVELRIGQLREQFQLP